MVNITNFKVQVMRFSRIITWRILKSGLRVHCLISEDRQVHYTDAGTFASARETPMRADLFFAGTGSIRGTLPAFYHRIGGSTPV